MPVKFPIIRDYNLAQIEEIQDAIAEWERSGMKAPTAVAWVLFKRWLTHPPRTASEGLKYDGLGHTVVLTVPCPRCDPERPPLAVGRLVRLGKFIPAKGLHSRYCGFHHFKMNGTNGVEYLGMLNMRTMGVKLRASAGQFRKTLKGWVL